jgi:hypothetical protein
MFPLSAPPSYSVGYRALIEKCYVPRFMTSRSLTTLLVLYPALYLLVCSSTRCVLSAFTPTCCDNILPVYRHVPPTTQRGPTCRTDDSVSGCCVVGSRMQGYTLASAYYQRLLHLPLAVDCVHQTGHSGTQRLPFLPYNNGANTPLRAPPYSIVQPPRTIALRNSSPIN